METIMFNEIIDPFDRIWRCLERDISAHLPSGLNLNLFLIISNF